MTVRHRNLLMAGAACGMVMLGRFSVRAARAVGTETAPVQVLASSQTASVAPGQRGATYYWLESQATRQTMTFGDATATSRRGPYGQLSTALTDVAGNELGRLSVDRPDGVHVRVRYVHASGSAIQMAGDPNVPPTLDWANQQAYHLWKDRVEPGRTTLEWRNGMTRAKGAAPRDAGQLATSLETQWTGGLSAKTVRKTVSHHEAAPGRFADGPVLATSLTDASGTETGIAYWYARPQILAWSLPGLDAPAYIAPEHLRADYGGWPFTPDMGWMNLQLIAFHHFKTTMNTQRFVAKTRPAGSRLLQFFAPTLLANEDGCDDLHWLDGTTLRYCCDDHDRCYAKAGCTASTWWKIWKSWTCDYCNEEVIHCFLRGGFGSGGFGKL